MLYLQSALCCVVCAVVHVSRNVQHHACWHLSLTVDSSFFGLSSRKHAVHQPYVSTISGRIRDSGLWQLNQPPSSVASIPAQFIKRKAGFDFKSWRLPIASASEPAAAQPASSSPTTAAGRDVVVIESLNDDECSSRGRAGPRSGALMHQRQFSDFKILLAS
jgi:hypothetical protein